MSHLPSLHHTLSRLPSFFRLPFSTFHWPYFYTPEYLPITARARFKRVQDGLIIVQNHLSYQVALCSRPIARTSAFARREAGEIGFRVMPIDYHRAVRERGLEVQKEEEVERRRMEWNARAVKWERELVEGGHRERTRLMKERWVDTVGWREAERLALHVEWEI